jgi:hypothetical protein
MNEIKKHTLKYIESFNEKDAGQVLNLLDDNVRLKDPGNEFFNKEEVASFLSELFKNEISFSARNIICEGNLSVIHFDLKLNDQELSGVDIIEWNNGKIKSLIAYL